MRILILGAGYAGLRAALDLGQAKRNGSLPDSVQVDLIEAAECHRVIFWMHQVAAGSLDPDDACLAYEDLPLDGIGLYRGEVTGIDPANRTVATSAGQFPFDRLVVALGSEPHLPSLPGLADYGHTVRDREGALALNRALEHAFAQAARVHTPKDQERQATVVVAGGGYTGCQLAGELAHRLPVLADRYGVPIARLRLVLAEAEDRLLPHMEPCHGRSARRLLERKGVEVRTGAPFERAGESAVVAGGREIPCATLAWSGGIRGPDLLSRAGLRLDTGGRLEVDQFLQVPDHPEVRGAGDCSARMDRPEAEATATEAINQGRYLASALADELRGRSPLPCRPNRLGLLVALGNADAVGTIGPVPVCGRAAGIVKNAAERTYPDTLRGEALEPRRNPSPSRPA